MKNSTFVQIALFQSLVLVATAASGSDLCAKIVPSKLTSAARSFLKKQNPKDSHQDWFANFVTENHGLCFLIMNDIRLSNPSGSPGPSEVLLIDPDTQNLSQFESKFSAPAKLRVALGFASESNPARAFFYAELSGTSVLEAMKSFESRVPVYGFTGCVDYRGEDPALEPTGKLSWDPTPNRKWKLSHAEYSLSRGSTSEVDDVTAELLDQEFGPEMAGTAPCLFDRTRSRGNLAPWQDSFIVQIHRDGTWIKADIDPRFELPSSPQFTHEVTFKTDVDPAHCLRQIKALGVTTLVQPVVIGPPGSAPVGADLILKPPFDKNLPRIESLACVERAFPL